MLSGGFSFLPVRVGFFSLKIHKDGNYDCDEPPTTKCQRQSSLLVSVAAATAAATKQRKN